MGDTELTVPNPFAYQKEPHARRHGPMGYSHHRDYRNWLRDEFAFRCIYCLIRETWLRRAGDWEIDHFLPKRDHPDAARDYDNLVYACNCCNRTKATKYLINPEQVAYGQCVWVDGKGEIHWLNEEGKNLIEALGLDDEDYTRMRRCILETLGEAPPDGKTYAWILGFPDNLPDLKKEPKPPGGNKRPKGIHDSWFEKHRANRCASYY